VTNPKEAIRIGYVEDVIDDTRCLTTDANGTLYTSRPHLFPKYFLKEICNSIKGDGDGQEAAIYLAEFGKAVFSGMDAGRLKEIVHNTIVRNAKESVFKDSTKRYIENHQFPGVTDFIRSYKNFGGGKKFIIASRHPLAEVAAEFFGADDVVSNKTIFRDGKFYTSYIPIRTDADKLRATEERLKEQNLSLEKDCLYIGDKDQDVLPGLKARHFWASPHANSKVKKEADFIVTDYRRIAKVIDYITARRLQQEMPKVQSTSQFSSSSEIS
jgi:phosphoserine phosphatase